jgi:hypothetical protein
MAIFLWFLLVFFAFNADAKAQSVVSYGTVADFNIVSGVIKDQGVNAFTESENSLPDGFVLQTGCLAATSQMPSGSSYQLNYLFESNYGGYGGGNSKGITLKVGGSTILHFNVCNAVGGLPSFTTFMQVSSANVQGSFVSPSGVTYPMPAATFNSPNKIYNVSAMNGPVTETGEWSVIVANPGPGPLTVFYEAVYASNSN